MSEEFVVNDRRLFSKDGRINNEAGGVETPGEPQAETPAEAGAPAEEPVRPDPPPKSRPAPGGPPREMPPPSFPSLLVGLATSALIHLGESPEPGQAAPTVDLPAAKHAIDLLGILQTKTKGNLESEEEALLETLLYDLRLKFVKASQ
jgi:hypothetical protein